MENSVNSSAGNKSKNVNCPEKRKDSRYPGLQEAGYSWVNQPQVVKIAEEIRRRCKRCIRNPDGYEIWPNY